MPFLASSMEVEIPCWRKAPPFADCSLVTRLKRGDRRRAARDMMLEFGCWLRSPPFVACSSDFFFFASQMAATTGMRQKIEDRARAVRVIMLEGALMGTTAAPEGVARADVDASEVLELISLEVSATTNAQDLESVLGMWI